jgi:hypothetical protein
MVADVSAEGCRSLVEEIEVAGGTVDFVAGDVRDRAYCERIVAGTVERFGGGSVAGEASSTSARSKGSAPIPTTPPTARPRRACTE